MNNNLQHTEVSLRAVTRHNFEQAGALRVSVQQQHFVDDNLTSMAKACFNPHYQMRGVYYRDKMVGFIMFDSQAHDRISLVRFMIDEGYQGQGIGRQAMAIVLREIKSQRASQEVGVCYTTTNQLASQFYQTMGFEETAVPGERIEAVIKL